jgi:hypothetical protein
MSTFPIFVKSGLRKRKVGTDIREVKIAEAVFPYPDGKKKMRLCNLHMTWHYSYSQRSFSGSVSVSRRDLTLALHHKIQRRTVTPENVTVATTYIQKFEAMIKLFFSRA